MQHLIVPIITPFTKDNKVDTKKLKDHAKNLLEKGIDIFFLNGTTGLGPSLSSEEKKSNLEALYEVTNKIIFQIGGLNLQEIISLAKYASKFDIIGIASYPPYYYPRYGENWVKKYYEALCEASERPVYIYNYPGATNIDVEPKIVAQLPEKVSGIKDTNQDLAHSLEYKRLIPRLRVYNGSDTLVFSSLASELDGVVASCGNYIPEALVNIRRLVNENKRFEAIKIQFLINKLVSVARKYGQLSANYVLVKLVQKYDVGFPREPIFPLNNEEESMLKKEAEPIIHELINV
jgi:2-keto-3-deoxy-phosphogluconate aldolase (EC 4.1.2.14)/2-keto-3-deoxygluconate aldolase (EC 4.1.2.-)/2-keto-3-deoxygalactonate aldolase (EC 4.1.2.-)/2-keto-3-deoxy-phosphogalactonate aldolase (EC 4.1.2.21)